jgi:putative transposase
MQYRLARTPGATYFFTVVTFRRRPFLTDPGNVELLRAAFRVAKSENPFSIDAFVLLPEHLHCVWTLPPEDSDYPQRWNRIKKYFTDHCPDVLKIQRTAAQLRKRFQTVRHFRYRESPPRRPE